MSKPVIATASLAGCFGCHMSFLDIDDRIIKLIELVEFNKSPIDDIKTFTKPVDVGLIEGGCCNSENVAVLRSFRKNCKVLVSVGECAIMGGLPAMRNGIPVRECLEEAYLNGPTIDPGNRIIPGRWGHGLPGRPFLQERRRVRPHITGSGQWVGRVPSTLASVAVPQA